MNVQNAPRYAVVAVVVVVGIIISWSLFVVIYPSSSSTRSQTQNAEESTTQTYSAVPTPETTVQQITSNPTRPIIPVDWHNLVSTIPSLFGNVSQMTAQYLINGSIGTLSFQVLGHSTIDAGSFLKVNLTLVSSQRYSAIAWFSSNGDVSTVIIGGKNESGSAARADILRFTAPYLELFSYVRLMVNNSTALSRFQGVSSETVSYGPTQIVVTTYNVPALFLRRGNFTIFAAAIGAGTLSLPSQKSITVLTNSVVQTSKGLFRVSIVSIQPASS